MGKKSTLKATKASQPTKGKKPVAKAGKAQPNKAAYKKRSYLNVETSSIACKEKRVQIVEKRKHEVKKLRTKQRRERKQDNLDKN